MQNLKIENKNMIPPGLEPGTLRVLGARDNRYTTESDGGDGKFLDVIIV